MRKSSQSCALPLLAFSCIALREPRAREPLDLWTGAQPRREHAEMESRAVDLDPEILLGVTVVLRHDDRTAAVREGDRLGFHGRESSDVSARRRS